MDAIIKLADVAMCIFTVGAIIRIMRTVTMIKRYGIENLTVSYSDRKENDDIKVYDEMSGFMNTMLYFMVIFTWLYAHFWM